MKKLADFTTMAHVIGYGMGILVAIFTAL